MVSVSNCMVKSKFFVYDECLRIQTSLKNIIKGPI